MMALPPPASAVRVRDEQHLSRIAPNRRAIVGQLAANGSSPYQFCPVVKAEHFSQSFIPCCLPHAKFYKVEAILRPWRVPHVSSGSFKMGIRGVTVSDVRGFGAQGRNVERQAGSELSEDNFVTKTKIEIVAGKDRVEAVAGKMIEEARTGEIGDNFFRLRNYCNNRHYLATRNKIDLCPKQISIMKSTAFANLIDMPQLHVDTTLLEDIIEMYRGDSTFEIAQGVNVVMKVEDVGRILGIPSKGVEIVRFGPSSRLAHASSCLFGEEFIRNRKTKRKVGGRDKEYNTRGYKLDKNNLGELWRELATKKKEKDIVNMCRVWMLYLMSTFLIPLTSYCVPLYMIHYLHDVQSTTSMNWAKLVHQILFKNMETMQIEIRKKRKGEYYKRILQATGCTMCLIVWILELTNIATPQFPHLRPRIKKWAAPIKKKMKLSDVDGSKVLKEIEYDKDDEWPETKDEEQEPYLASAGSKVLKEIEYDKDDEWPETKDQEQEPYLALEGSKVLKEIEYDKDDEWPETKDQEPYLALVGSKVLKEIEYDKDDEWPEMKDQEQEPYLASAKPENEKAIEDMLKTLKLGELVRHKQKFNATFLEKFCNLIKENRSLKKRNTELEDENKYLKEYFNRDLNEVIHEISQEQPNVRYLMIKRHVE